MFVVKSTQAVEFGNDDFDSITGWSSGDNESNVTKYSAEIASLPESKHNHTVSIWLRKVGSFDNKNLHVSR